MSPAHRSLVTAWCLALALCVGSARDTLGQTDPGAPLPVVIDFFYEPGCPECQRVKEEILPVLESRFDGFYVLIWNDVGIASNVLKLVAYQAQLGTRDRNEPVSMVVDYTYSFHGINEIRRGLLAQVERSVEVHLKPDWKPPAPIVARTDAGGQVREAVKAAGRFAWLAVVLGGLADGINPCAMSTLVFFMSLLAVAKVRGRGLVVMGVSFCLASFLVYTALGFGLLRVLHSVSAFPAIRKGINLVMLAALGLLAFLSFRDAWRFKRTGDARSVTLQLPDALKKRMHAVMRTRLKNSSLIAGGLLVGAIVTVIESVCTGQVYVPTLVVVIRSGQASTREWGFLLLYNLMFIVPLVTVFVLAYLGLKTEALINWSRQNVVHSKIVLGSLFLALMAFMLVL
jgi:hypothetical protein